jgi:23S rRNA (cytosine1962-C5)-methyltransferase
MKNYPKIILKRGKEAAIRRFHPWLFSGAIARIKGSPGEGDIVEIYSATDDYLATGHFLRGSIAVKIFSFTSCDIDYSFWKEKIQAAYNLRTKAGLTDSSVTNAYRLVFTEGDDLPGLIIDWYNGVVVIQTHNPGMHRIKKDLVNILQEIYGKRLTAVYDKSSDTMNVSSSEEMKNSVLGPASSGTTETYGNQYLFGSYASDIIMETGHSFKVDWEKGQKTGFFLDQRSNRMFAQYYSKNKKVLNAFCYSGAFSVYALKGGAAIVHSVDSSRQALQILEENITLNGIDKNKHKSILGDVKKYFSENEDHYDLIILDPPAFAKHHNITHNALQGYIYINTEALKKMNAGGILMTFSCSQAVSREMFQSAVLSAAIESGRKIKILHQLSQGPDHPYSIYHPEGEYLKGLILYVE